MAFTCSTNYLVVDKRRTCHFCTTNFFCSISCRLRARLIVTIYALRRCWKSRFAIIWADRSRFGCSTKNSIRIIPEMVTRMVLLLFKVSLCLSLLFLPSSRLSSEQTNASTVVRRTNVSLLWLYDKWLSPHGRGVIPAGYLAYEHVNAHPTLLGDLVNVNLIAEWTRYDVLYSVQEALRIIVMRIYGATLPVNSRINMIIGPYTATEAKAVAQLAPNWNILTLSYFATSPALNDPNVYPLFARVSGSDGDFSQAVLAVLQHLKYTHVVCLYLNEGFSLDMQPILEPFLTANNISITKTSVFKEADSRNYSLSVVQAVKTFAIVLVDGGDHGRQLLCEAYKQRGISGHDYVWLTFGTNTPIWYRSLSSDSVKCTADEIQAALTGSFMFSYNGWDTSSTQPTVTGYTVQQVQKLIAERIARDYPGTSTAISTVASYQYDAIVAGAMALRNVERLLRAQNKSLSEFEYTTGSAVALMLKRELLKLDFQGVTGRVRFLPSGDRLPHIPIWQFQREDEFVQVGTYDDSQQPRLQLTKPLKFDTPSGDAPPDVLTDRFFDRPLNVVFVAILASLGGIGPLAVYVARRSVKRAHYAASLKAFKWQILPDELHVGSKGSRRSSYFESISTLGDLSVIPATGSIKWKPIAEVVDTVRDPVIQRYGDFRGQPCVLLRANGQQASFLFLTRELLLELKHAYDHGISGGLGNNLATFFGLFRESPEDAGIVGTSPWSVVFEHGAKGSLRTMISNDKISLDKDMFFSLLSDLARGLTDVHKHFNAHGRLLSSFCTIDARFSLKIFGYGMPSLVDMRKSWDSSEVEDKLCCSPELLRCLLKPNSSSAEEQKDVPVLNMKSCDMYSLAVIVSEMANRSPAFYSFDRAASEVLLKKIANDGSASDSHISKPTPTRPFIPTETMPSVELVALVQRSWHETPTTRPTAQQFYDTLRHIMRATGISSNIFENLLKRMEKYALDLEDIVQERTEAMFEEKKRAEVLLYNILPHTVADALKMGQTVLPEAFESVTIYFSDIVGFTSLSASSTPFQVIDVLNDLYTMFDETIAAYDVYKVETIGDAYMVVSGLPVRNGTDHARQIALLSLALLEIISHKFVVRHRPEEKLKLRIGMHTGACAAGVVGFVMPRYCLFGDTVNTASRMESSGEALKIHASEDVYVALRQFEDEFQLARRGDIEVKGKGLMTTFWLTGVVSDLHK